MVVRREFSLSIFIMFCCIKKDQNARTLQRDHFQRFDHDSSLLPTCPRFTVTRFPRTIKEFSLWFANITKSQNAWPRVKGSASQIL